MCVHQSLIRLAEVKQNQRTGVVGNRVVARIEPSHLDLRQRIEAAVAGKTNAEFVVMARTDALAVEGMNAALARARRYVEAGAEMIFAEACTDLVEFRAFTDALRVPVLANMTEFGKTPLFNGIQLRMAGVAMALYPLSAFRAMNAAAVATYRTIREDGTQRAVLDRMQTREELYEVLNYHAAEQQQHVAATPSSQKVAAAPPPQTPTQSP